MDEQIRQGQKVVLAIIATTLLVSLTNIVVVLVVGGERPAPRDFGRFVLTALLCFFLYQGRSWVRWVLGGLLGLGAIFAAVAGLALLRQMPGAGSLWLLVLAILYGACSGMLFFSSSLKAFLAHQRAQHAR